MTRISLFSGVDASARSLMVSNATRGDRRLRRERSWMAALQSIYSTSDSSASILVARKSEEVEVLDAEEA